MIKVNLLSTAPGATPARDWFPREQRTALMGLGMLVVTALIVGGWYFYLGSVQSSIDSRIAASEAQLEKLKEASKLVEKTNARKTELAERLAVIERLRAAKRGPVNLLETLSQSLPEGLWLLEVKQAGLTVQVDGRAMSLSAVTDFTERMQNSGLFNRPVEILTTTTETVEETNVVRFAVKADFVPPATPTTAVSGAVATAPKTIASSAPARTGV
jgi:type IV pilus assembly protein PilN